MIQPTTLFLGAKASELYHKLAAENGVSRKYFFTQMIIREARSEATMLVADRLKERLALIDEVNNELVDLINNPPKEQLADREYSTKPKVIYAKIWEAHRRLKARGWDEERIHGYCLDRYGMDFKISKTPTKTPKRNPMWTGGGRVAAKLKEKRRLKIEVESGVEDGVEDENS